MGRRRANRATTGAAEGATLQVSFRRALAFGPGKARLLLAIETHGSITAAATALEMPYRRAWDLVDEMNTMFRAPLVARQAGGPGGGGALLTDTGRTVTERYRSLDATVQAALAGDMVEFRSLMADARSMDAGHGTLDDGTRESGTAIAAADFASPETAAGKA